MLPSTRLCFGGVVDEVLVVEPDVVAVVDFTDFLDLVVEVVVAEHVAVAAFERPESMAGQSDVVALDDVSVRVDERQVVRS